MTISRPADQNARTSGGHASAPTISEEQRGQRTERDPGEQRRRQVGMRYRPVRQEVAQLLTDQRPVRQHQTGTGQQRHAQLRHRRVETQRDQLRDPAPRPRAQPHPLVLRKVRQTTVGHDDGFGASGGAAGVDEVGGVGGVECGGGVVGGVMVVSGVGVEGEEGVVVVGRVGVRWVVVIRSAGWASWSM